MLRISNLTKNYGTFSLNCSMEVKQGQITGLVGQNGAGKSTTFKAVLGLIRPDSGQVKVLGKPAQALGREEKQHLGVVLSDSGFSGFLTIKDVAAILAGFYKSFDKAAFFEKCREFELPLNKKIKEFSAGMKVKLKVIAAMTHKPKLLLLDEPTAGLDVVARDDVLAMLREYMAEDERRGILISSHISTDLEGLCDDLYMIHKGQIIFHEDTDVLLSEYAVLKVDRAAFRDMDKRYILKYKKESFGYSCLTKEKAFYLENYPSMVVENGSLDELIMMMIRGEDL